MMPSISQNSLVHESLNKRILFHSLFNGLYIFNQQLANFQQYVNTYNYNQQQKDMPSISQKVIVIRVCIKRLVRHIPVTSNRKHVGYEI